jgi:small GTP-binding protein
MFSIRCVAVGDEGVGKTSLLIAYSTGHFPSEYLPKRFDSEGIGMYFEGKMISLHLHDTHGAVSDDTRQSRFSLADVCLICYSVASPSSFESVKSKWFSEVQSKWPTAKYILVGTHADLRGEKENTYFSDSKESEIFVSSHV